MKKVSKSRIVLIVFVSLSILLFLLLVSVIPNWGEKDSSDPFAAMGQAIDFLLTFLIAYPIFLSIIALAGILIYKKSRNLELHRGFKYSLLYSLAALCISTLYVLKLYFAP
jgi:type II secretory pathway component PulF